MTQDILFITDLSSDDKFNVFYMLLLITFIGSSVIMHFRGKPIKLLKTISIWLIIIILLVIAYSYRYDAKNIKDRLIGELFPSQAIESNNGSIDFRVSRDGHYHISAEVNRANVEFLLDTGASDIVLSRKAAKRIGINPNDLNFTKIYNTANGTVRGAPILLKKIKIGSIIMYDVPASVNETPMNKSLLGMSFLDKLDGYEVRGGILSLWP